MSDEPKRIALIPGDGIGPEIVDAAVAVLDAVAGVESSLRLEFETIHAGAATFVATGSSIAAEAVERMRAGDFDAILKGPVGLPDVRLPDGTEAGLLGGILRSGLDTFANVRPMVLRAGVEAPLRREAGEIDYVIVRENTEGLYASRGGGARTASTVTDTLIVTRPGVERVVRFAFELAARRSGAPADRIRRVTCVDKSNVLRSFALFRAVFLEVAEDYPDIEPDLLYADAAAQALVVDPGRFDVLVMENFLGDVLSDLGAGTVGGLGMCPAANIGETRAYFEPVHGSAPSIAGLDRANPISQILAAGMLLDHIGASESAGRLVDAVDAVLRTGAVTTRGGSPAHGTRAATRAIVDAISAGR